MDPEYSILKSRMDNHINTRGVNPKSLDLPALTKLAEEAITSVSDAGRIVDFSGGGGGGGMTVNVGLIEDIQSLGIRCTHPA